MPTTAAHVTTQLAQVEQIDPATAIVLAVIAWAAYLLLCRYQDGGRPST